MVCELSGRGRGPEPGSIVCGRGQTGRGWSGLWSGSVGVGSGTMVGSRVSRSGRDQSGSGRVGK